MAELPELPKHILRLHFLRWKDLTEKHGLTGGHLDWHQSPQRRAAALPPVSLLPHPLGSAVTYYGKHGEEVSYKEWVTIQKAALLARQNDPVVVDTIGVAATVALAQERFEGIVGDYFAIWGSESERDSDEFPQWLERLRKLILIEVGDLWRKGEWHTAWFERACREKVDDGLTSLNKEWATKARKLETDQLESLNRPTVSRFDLGTLNLGSQSYQDAFAKFKNNRQEGLTKMQAFPALPLHLPPAVAEVEKARPAPSNEVNTRMPAREPSITKSERRRGAMADSPDGGSGPSEPSCKNPFPEGDSRHEAWVAFSIEVPQSVRSASENQTRANAQIGTELRALINAPSEQRDQLWIQTVRTLRSIERRIDWPDATPTDDGLVQLLLDATLDSQMAVLRRLDTLTEKALEMFVVGAQDIDSWPQILQFLVDSALASCSSPSPLFRDRISEQQQRWGEIARKEAEDAWLPPRRWNIDGSADRARAAAYERLAVHLMDVQGVKFEHPFQAADALLDSLHEYLLQIRSLNAPQTRTKVIKSLCIASAEYCSELKIGALKVGNTTKAELLSEIDRQFRALAGSTAIEDPKADLAAIHRGTGETQPCSRVAPVATAESEAERSPDSEVEQVSHGADEADEKDRGIGPKQSTIPPVESREQRLQQFITTHSGVTLADIKYSAGVFTSDFQKWRNRELKPDSIMSGRIEDVLTGRRPLLKKPRKKRTD